MTDRILLVDDDRAFRVVYADLLRGAGVEVDEADDRPSTTQALREHAYPVVLLDLMLPPDGSVTTGLAQLAEILDQHPATKVIVASGAGDQRFVVQAVRDGAFDFLTKPIDPDVLLIVVQRALARARLERRVENLQSQVSQAAPAQSMIGTSPAFQAALRMAEQVAPSDLPVLVTGENGTGKELMARRVHASSHRADAPFVALNCGAVPQELFESTLFGHRRGAFTGAHADRPGLFVEADRGTLFLDEIGDMPVPSQVKLLRVLESGELLPVGADRPITVDVRIVSATNRDLDALLESEEFREDLYWRINGAQIHLPPLRARPSDIPLLAAHFLNQASALSPTGAAKSLSDEATAALIAHEWSGNLRELRHEMQRATVMTGDRDVIEPSDLAFARRAPATTAASGALADKIESLERREIELALARHSGNRTRAADDLGLSRQGLLNKMGRYAIE